jgi:hypothetical protein
MSKRIGRAHEHPNNIRDETWHPPRHKSLTQIGIQSPSVRKDGLGFQKHLDITTSKKVSTQYMPLPITHSRFALAYSFTNRLLGVQGVIAGDAVVSRVEKEYSEVEGTHMSKRDFGFLDEVDGFRVLRGHRKAPNRIWAVAWKHRQDQTAITLLQDIAR